MNFSKKELIVHCKELLLSRGTTLKNELAVVREAASNETKSSMGDKYETSREMIRQEENKLISQLKVVEDQLVALERVNADKLSDKVEVGSLVETKTAKYFISTSLGKVEVGGGVVFLISPVAPLARLLLGKVPGEEIRFNNVNHRIISIK